MLLPPTLLSCCSRPAAYEHAAADVLQLLPRLQGPSGASTPGLVKELQHAYTPGFSQLFYTTVALTALVHASSATLPPTPPCTRGFYFVPQIELLAICSLQRAPIVPQAALDCMADPADSFLFMEPCITTQADPAAVTRFPDSHTMHHNRSLLVSSFSCNTPCYTEQFVNTHGSSTTSAL